MDIKDGIGDSVEDKASLKRGLLFVANVPAPYRYHLHEYLANELKCYEHHLIFTHGEGANSGWVCDVPGNIQIQSMSPDRKTGWLSSFDLIKQFYISRNIVEHIRNNDIEAVFLHGYNDLTRLHLIKWCARNGIPCFLRSDSNSRSDHSANRPFRQFIKRKLLEWVKKRISGVLPVGRYGEEFYRQYGFSDKDMFRVPFFPDYSLFSTRQNLVSPELVDLFSTNRRRFLYVGRLVEYKDVLRLLRAFMTLSDKIPLWDLVIVGKGPQEELLQQTAGDMLNHRVHFLGFKQVNEVAAIMQRCDVLVLPSTFEPWALVINEALAAGMAIVASDAVGAAGDLVKDELNGKVYPAGDTEALKACLMNVSQEECLQSFRMKAPHVLDQWVCDYDPAEGIRCALRSAGLSIE